MRRSFLALAASSFLLVGGARSHAGEPIRCTCYFEQNSGYSAVGTRAACSTMTHKNMRGPGEYCEISFGATGAEQSVASQLNISPAALDSVAFKVTNINLQSMFKHDAQPVSNAGYLHDAIPAYMRATYLREGAQLDAGTRSDLDKQVLQIADKFAEPIAEVFQGKRGPFDTKLGDKHDLTVERGAVRFIYVGEVPLTLVAVFFDPRNVR